MHATYTIMEFMALLTGHIPSPYESLVYYYGLYSSSHRGKERRENRDDQSIEIQETKGAGRASPTWARLIQRIFEVNPLQCIKCGGNMRGIACIERSENIAFITDYQTSKKILKHIGEETISFRFAQCKHCPPPLRANIPTANIPDTVFWDSIPPVEAYFPSMIPSMSIKKSPEVLPDHYTQKQGVYPYASGKPDKAAQNRKISPMPTADGHSIPPKTLKFP